jgi:N-dimethylarginine dimethylaminohydrolase
VGNLEGGDIIVTPTEVLVGLSQRTDLRGALELGALVDPVRTVRPIELADDVLHLDVAMNLLGPDVGIIHRPSIAAPLPASLRAVDWIEVTDEEFQQQGANLLSLGPRKVAFDSRHQRIAAELQSRGFDCLPLDLEEITKVGGGVRCMTLPLRRVRQLA